MHCINDVLPLPKTQSQTLINPNGESDHAAKECQALFQSIPHEFHVCLNNFLGEAVPARIAFDVSQMQITSCGHEDIGNSFKVIWIVVSYFTFLIRSLKRLYIMRGEKREMPSMRFRCRGLRLIENSDESRIDLKKLKERAKTPLLHIVYVTCPTHPLPNESKHLDANMRQQLVKQRLSRIKIEIKGSLCDPGRLRDSRYRCLSVSTLTDDFRSSVKNSFANVRCTFQTRPASSRPNTRLRRGLPYGWTLLCHNEELPSRKISMIPEP